MNRERFVQTFGTLRRLLSNCLTSTMNETDAQYCTSRINKLFAHTIEGGKHERALLLIGAYSALQPASSEAQMMRAVRLGWTIEMMQSHFLIADDIVDGGRTRRGRPCWHTLPDIGLGAVNDALLLECGIDAIVADEFATDHRFGALTLALQQTKQQTVMGQTLDNATRGLADCTAVRYGEIVSRKTSHYTFFAPVQLALILADRLDAFDPTRRLCNDLGYYFQAQDDYLDCFGDPAVTGKVGTDIEEGKCTWATFTTAALLSNDKAKRAEFESNFGITDATAAQRAKQMMRDLNIPELYRNFQSAQYSKLCQQIDAFPVLALRPVFRTAVDSLHNRQK
uniref:Farnesyl pyrophosphate synthase n=1 Tax=Plectus sambesii TaxID=2011161 RepID=A0A914VTD6_9BILA